MKAVPRRAALASLAGIAFASMSSRLAAADLEPISAKTLSGRTVSAFLAVPSKTPAPAIMLIHGAHGLTGYYKSTAIEFAKEGFVALAIDLYDGQLDASRDVYFLMATANENPQRTAETITTWIDWLKHDQRTNSAIALVGYSFGAEWALRISLSVPVEATVIYVGLILPTVEELARLRGPTLGLFADWGNDPPLASVDILERRMKQAGKSFEVHTYAAGHGFGNREFADYNKPAAEAAWAATLKFLRANLKS